MLIKIACNLGLTIYLGGWYYLISIESGGKTYDKKGNKELS